MEPIMNRRTFLLLVLTYSGAALASTGAQQTKNHLRMSAGGAPFTPSQGVWAWLRMSSTSGEFAIPTSETDYLANLGTIRVAMPLNAGKLQATGEWLQESWKVDHAWARGLADQAHATGQSYMPGAGNDREGILTVLDDPALRQAAADNLVALAITGRFDAPWDGVYLDLEGIPYAYQRQLSDFHYLLADKLRAAGLLVGVSVRGRTGDSGEDFDDAYTYDFSILHDVADFVDLRCYNYWKPFPRSISPYWWIQASIEYALAKGVSPTQMTLGLGNFSRYWPSSDEGESDEITYEHAVALAEEAGTTIEWVEANENGLVRESFARIDGGHLWIHDAATMEQELACVNQYGLLGATLFTPGMGYDDQWQILANWTYPTRHYLPQIGWQSDGGSIVRKALRP
jgi:spore germination protein YaaH